MGKRNKPTRAGAHESSMATEQAEQKAEKQVDTVVTATAQENATCDVGPEDTLPTTTEEAVFASCPTGGTANPNPIEDTARSNPIGDLSIPNPLGNTASLGVVVEDTAVHHIEDSSVLLSEHHGNLPEAEREEDKVVEKLSSVHLSSIAGVSNGTSDCTNGTVQPSAENGATPDDHILLACLRRFCALELLAGDNKFACPGCHARSKGSSHPDPLNSGPDHPGPLNSGPDHPDPLNSGPNHPDPLNSGPDHPDPLNSGPNHPGPLNSGPDHPDPLNSGPDHPDPLNSGPNHSDPLNSGPDHPGPLNSGPNHPDPLNSGPDHPDPLNSGIDHMSKQLSSIYVYDHLGTPIPAPNSIATADATAATQHLCAVDPSTSRGGGTSDPLPVERSGEENIPVDKEVDQSLPFDGEEDSSLSQSPQGGYQTGDTLARKCGRLLDSATLSSEDGEEEGLLSTEISISKQSSHLTPCLFLFCCHYPLCPFCLSVVHIFSSLLSHPLIPSSSHLSSSFLFLSPSLFLPSFLPFPLPPLFLSPSSSIHSYCQAARKRAKQQQQPRGRMLCILIWPPNRCWLPGHQWCWCCV